MPDDKLFKDWTEEEVIILLGLKRQAKNDKLTAWLASDLPLQEAEIKTLEKLRKKASHYIFAWNEVEWRVKFIDPITELVNFDVLEYFCTAFSERNLSATINGILLKGKVDWMVSIGKSQPVAPFFFIHEYKRTKGIDNDPLGQLLVSMLAAQQLNKEKQPNLFSKLFTVDMEATVYGCYIIGQSWFFVVLEQDTFTVSQLYDAADKQDLQQIMKILKKQKEMILDRLKKSTL